MFCPSCGHENPENAKFCANCGKAIAPGAQKEAFNRAVNDATNSAKNAAQNAAAAAGEAIHATADKVDSAVNELRNDFGGPAPSGGLLKTDRSLIAVVLLNIITCGIYYFFFIYSVANDVNIACVDDEKTPGLGMFIVLSILTCGFYSLYWEYKLGNRLASNASYYGIDMQENGSTILLWRIFGAFICAIGTYVGTYVLIKNVNVICDAYNRRNGAVG